LAQDYAGKQTKTVTRDINALAKMGLIRKSRTMIQSRFGDLRAFLPFRFDSEGGNPETNQRGVAGVGKPNSSDHT
jgi:hypothetical protein